MHQLFSLVSLFGLVTLSLNGQTGEQRFPQLKAQSLQKETIIFPDDLKNKANILILVFEQDAQRLVDTWAEVILADYEPRPDVSYHEVPMISGWYRPIGWQIDNWMRDGIPENLHDNTTTFYGNRRPYFEELNMNDIDSCYLFLLDREGYIRFRAEGPRDEEQEAALRTAIAKLTQNR